MKNLQIQLPKVITWRRQWHPTPVLLPGESHGWRSLVGCSPWGRYGVAKSRTRLHFHFHFSLSCIGEGNGNPLQCSCLENPRDGGTWWLPSMGSHRVGHDWSDLAAAAAWLWAALPRAVEGCCAVLEGAGGPIVLLNPRDAHAFTDVLKRW